MSDHLLLTNSKMRNHVNCNILNMQPHYTYHCMCYTPGLTLCCLKATFTNLCQSAQNVIHLKNTIDWHQLHAKMQTPGKGNTLLEVSFVCCFKATCMFYSLPWPRSCCFYVGLRLWNIFNYWRRNLQV